LQSRCSNRVLRSQTAGPARRRAENGQRRFIVDGILRVGASVVGAVAAAACHRWLGIGWGAVGEGARVVVWSRREGGGGAISGGGGGGAAAAGGWVYLRVCRAHGGAGRVQGDLPLRGRRGGGVARRAGPRHHDAR